MRAFLVGITGAVGGLLARRLDANGDGVFGLVRTAKQRDALDGLGIRTVIGDLAAPTVDELAEMFTGHDVIVYSAGSNGGQRDVTTAIDGDGVERASEAARIAGVRRLILVSVLPGSWRERDLEQDVEYYFAVKKRAEVSLTRTDLDWVILRPSLLTDAPGRGRVSMGPAELHDEISREDVAATLAEIVYEDRIRRQILELNTGSTAIPEAVLDNIRI
ncbi:NAD(P)H-binding protein [Specibacter sp. AOP5-B1-6]|uniref:NAD(P)H-binding protein n=1 Tax=Specibacter sp. AOP5-B1-6 TaxID=3457653 RepID=UPI00402B5693